MKKIGIEINLKITGMNKPHAKSEMLPYTGGPTVTFRAYVGDQFKDTNLDVQSVLAAHYEEKKTNPRLADFTAETCLLTVGNPATLTTNQRTQLRNCGTYTGFYHICTVSDFFKWFFAQEVENAILLDLEQEYRRELGERGEVEAEDRNDFYNCL